MAKSWGGHVSNKSHWQCPSERSRPLLQTCLLKHLFSCASAVPWDHQCLHNAPTNALATQLCGNGTRPLNPRPKPSSHTFQNYPPPSSSASLHLKQCISFNTLKTPIGSDSALVPTHKPSPKYRTMAGTSSAEGKVLTAANDTEKLICSVECFTILLRTSDVPRMLHTVSLKPVLTGPSSSTCRGCASPPGSTSIT